MKKKKSGILGSIMKAAIKIGRTIVPAGFVGWAINEYKGPAMDRRHSMLVGLLKNLYHGAIDKIHDFFETLVIKHMLLKPLMENDKLSRDYPRTDEEIAHYDYMKKYA